VKLAVHIAGLVHKPAEWVAMPSFIRAEP